MDRFLRATAGGASPGHTSATDARETGGEAGRRESSLSFTAKDAETQRKSAEIKIKFLPDTSLNPIQALEELKDRIVAAFRAPGSLGQDVIDVWCGDASEMYSSVLAARDLLLRRDTSHTRAASGLLIAASIHRECVASELRALGAAGAELEQELHRVFRACNDELLRCFRRIQ